MTPALISTFAPDYAAPRAFIRASRVVKYKPVVHASMKVGRGFDSIAMNEFMWEHYTLNEFIATLTISSLPCNRL